MESTSVTALPLVVQHNALVNARFNMSALEMRFFLALLSRIGRDDDSFTVCEVPVREICSSSASNAIYNEVREMVRSIGTRALFIEALSPEGKRVKDPDVLTLPLMGRAHYRRKTGVVEASFNENIRPYLLELRDNFTKAQLSQLLKLKSPVSHRIYWLLREYAAFGKRVIGLAELRNVLGLTTEYQNRFDHFRDRVLDRAQTELAQTDLPFTYEVIKQGRVITEIRFLFEPAGGTSIDSVKFEPTGWETALLAAGVGEKSLPVIRLQLESGVYEEQYIYFVLQTIRAKVLQGKVKKEGGAVFKALTEGYLLNDFRKQVANIQVKQQKIGKRSGDSASVRIRLEDAEAAYETMRKKGKAPSTFAENLEQTYLNQGFMIVQNETGNWLIKD
ncbi:MAG: hypothetical protein JWP58_3832 [Hymenobacter sp.]|nr:hypothetical protein [Hymenobacter sp.]